MPLVLRVVVGLVSVTVIIVLHAYHRVVTLRFSISSASPVIGSASAVARVMMLKSRMFIEVPR